MKHCLICDKELYKWNPRYLVCRSCNIDYYGNAFDTMCIKELHQIYRLYYYLNDRNFSLITPSDVEKYPSKTIASGNCSLLQIKMIINDHQYLDKLLLLQ